MSRLRLAVIGVGHLGKEHARILAGMPEVELVGVADLNAEQAQNVAVRCGTRAHKDYRTLLHGLDAAVIVTPTSSHHAVASEFLASGVSLLVEKPLAANLEQAEELVDLARRHGAFLQVGHIERFNPAFEELQRRPLQPKYVSCQRIGQYTGRSLDIGAVLDLMIHDLDLLLALMPVPVDSVQALGLSVLGGPEDMARARLTFANGCIADLSASRISFEPARCMDVWAPEGFVHLDFSKKHLVMVQPSDELRRRRESGSRPDPAWTATLKQNLMGRHLQTLHLDRSGGDQLTVELKDFIHCLQTGARPRVSGEDGRNAVALACRVLECIRTHAWESAGHAEMGPLHLPTPLGPLFQPSQENAAA